MSRIAPYITDMTRLELMAIVVDTVTGSTDRLAWVETKDGEFTVASAHELLTRVNAPQQNMERFYERIWKASIPERVRTFLWLVSQQVIMTNQERKRRHLCDSDICQVCKGGVESILHVLRDYPVMEGIWIRLVPVRKRGLFFKQTLFEWMFLNLSDHSCKDGVAWSTMFALGIWWGWKWRCGNVFGVTKLCRDKLRFLKELGQEISLVEKQSHSMARRTQRVERMIAWVEPKGGWFKMNTDGASKGNPGLAAAGGVLRNERGEWCGGFALNIGCCSAPLAELWRVYYGLYIAWEKRVECLELEVDSEMVVKFLMTGIGEAHPLSFLVRLCHGFLSKDWIVRVFHVYRETNRLADGLASYAFSLPLGFYAFSSVPADVAVLFNKDVS